MALRVNFNAHQASIGRSLSRNGQRAYDKLFTMRAKDVVVAPQIKRMILRDRQRCMECGGVFTIQNARVVKMQSIDAPYRHKDDCSQKGRF